MKAVYCSAITQENIEQVIRDILEEVALEEGIAEFFAELATSCEAHRNELTACVATYLASGWEISRIAAVDLAILLVASEELFYWPNIPPKVSINEAVILAKEYSSPESARFINGVLGKVLSVSPKKAWNPTESTDFEEAPQVQSLEPTILEEVIEGSDEESELKKAGPWTLISRPESP